MDKSLCRISIKRAYEPYDGDDGWRVLVDRLWPRGVRKSVLHLDEWLKDVAPSVALRKWFDHDPAKFNQFRLEYLKELRHGNDELYGLLRTVRTKKVTLVYAAHDEIHNHAQVLREFLCETVEKDHGML